MNLSKGNAKLVNLIKNAGGSVYDILKSKKSKANEHLYKIGEFKLLHEETKIVNAFCQGRQLCVEFSQSDIPNFLLLFRGLLMIQ